MVATPVAWTGFGVTQTGGHRPDEKVAAPGGAHDGAGRGDRGRLQRDRRRHRAETARHHGLHHLRGRTGRRRDLVVQPVPRRRGGPGVARLLVLLRPGGLEPHPRRPGRAAALPRVGHRLLRTAAAPGAERAGGEHHLGRGPGRVPDRHLLGHIAPAVPGGDQRRRVPERAAHPVVAPRGAGLRRGGLPHRQVARRPRSGRPAGRGARHRLLGRAGGRRGRRLCRRGQGLPARAELAAAQGQPRFQPGGAPEEPAPAGAPLAPGQPLRSLRRPADPDEPREARRPGQPQAPPGRGAVPRRVAGEPPRPAAAAHPGVPVRGQAHRAER